MKTITRLSLLALLMLAQITMAQQTTDIQTLLDRLQENHMGSITEVFSNEEIEQLRIHFDAKSSTKLVRIAGAMDIHAIENTQGNFSKIEPSNPSEVQLIAPSPLMEFEGAGATKPFSNLTTVVDNSNKLYTVNSIGEYVFEGQITLGGGLSFTGLEYASDGTLYGIATDGMGTTQLFQIDEFTLAATPVGGPNGLVVGIALGRDANNNLYSYDIDTDLVSRIDRTTGAATTIGPLGFDANFAQGMGFDEATGDLLITAFNNATFKAELRRIDINTGAAALIATIEPDQTFQLAWMSFYDTTLGVNESPITPFTIYPNPATEVLNISSEMTIDSVVVYTTLGQEVFRQEMNDSNSQVDVSGLSKGFYILQITSGQTQSSLSFIKE